MDTLLGRLKRDAADLWSRGTAGKLTIVCAACAVIGVLLHDPVPNMTGDSVTIGVMTALFAYRHDIASRIAGLGGSR